MKSVWGWLVRRGDDIFVGVVASVIFAMILRIPKLKEIVFDIPRQPTCSTVKPAEYKKGYLFKQEWIINIPISKKDKGPFKLLYVKSDGHILNGTLKYENPVYNDEPMTKYSSGDFKGAFLYFYPDKKSNLKVTFTTESERPMKGSTCENFTFSL